MKQINKFVFPVNNKWRLAVDKLGVYGDHILLRETFYPIQAAILANIFVHYSLSLDDVDLICEYMSINGDPPLRGASIYTFGR